MKKLLSLLSVLTISGTAVPTTIAASNYEKQLQTNTIVKDIGVEFQQVNNLESLNRNKRDIKNNLEINYSDNTNFSTLTAGIFIPFNQEKYFMNVIDLTEKINYIDWSKLKEDYKYITFNNLKINFSRSDNNGGIISTEENINFLTKNVLAFNSDISNWSNSRYTTHKGPNMLTFESKGSIENYFQDRRPEAFETYLVEEKRLDRNTFKDRKIRIFDQSIKYRATVVQGQITMLLQSYNRSYDNHLILRVIYYFNNWTTGTTSDTNLKLNVRNKLILNN